MTYTVCAEWFLLYQTGMNLIMLSLLEQLFFSTATLKRKLLVSIIGALVGLGILWIPFRGMTWKLICSALGDGILLVWLCFPWEKVKRKVKMCSVMVLFSFFSGSVLQRLKDTGYIKPLFFQLLLVTYGLYIGLIHIYRRQMDREKQRIYQITLSNGEMEASMLGLMDSGNLLRAVNEQFSSKPCAVVVVEKGSIPENMLSESGFVIRYQTMGNPEGKLEGYVMQRMLINGNGMTRQYENVYVGIYETGLTQNGYQAILPTFFDLNASYHK